jgi:hypothetical protein
MDKIKLKVNWKEEKKKKKIKNSGKIQPSKNNEK